MDRKLLAKIGAEIDTVARVRRVAEPEVVRRVLEFIDVEFHGVVPLPLEQSGD